MKFVPANGTLINTSSPGLPSHIVSPISPLSCLQFHTVKLSVAPVISARSLHNPPNNKKQYVIKPFDYCFQDQMISVKERGYRFLGLNECHEYQYSKTGFTEKARLLNQNKEHTTFLQSMPFWTLSGKFCAECSSESWPVKKICVLN